MASSQFRDALRQIHRLFTVGSVAGLSDASLLCRFIDGRDGEAFGALVARHGPMVLSVCQGMLRDPRDVEDAFQATFLVLVRRAGSVRVDGSLGGWLSRVASRVALQARADALRRRARESRDVDIDAIAGADGLPGEGPTHELHEEIARLPESYRRAVVLCDLEGMTQVQAAQELRCGEATLRRRLAGARERLRNRLERRGVAPAFALPAKPAAVPTAWAEGVVQAAVAGRPATAAVGRLAAAVLVVMTRARRLRVAAALIGVGMTTALVALAAQDPPPKPDRPAAQPAAKADTPAPERPWPHWVHKKSDTFWETWACLDDAREFIKKSDKEFSLHDPAAKKDYTYKGGDSITCADFEGFVTAQDGKGRSVPRSALELLYEPGMTPIRATDQDRKSQNVFMEYVIETVNGRRLGRLDQYIRDALGEARVDNQTWYDLETKLPVRRKDRLQVASQHEFKREFATTEFDYPATGPADLYAIGVPKGTPVVVKSKKRMELADLPPEIQRCMRGAAEALRRFPRDFRAMSIGRPTRMEYWSCPPEWMELRSNALRDGFSPAFDGDHRPLHFTADNQEGWPGDLEPENGFKLKGDPLLDWLADRFPFDKSVNIALEDGKRTYHLTRFYVAEGKPRREELHVLGGNFPDELPGPLEAQWPYANWGYSRLSLPPPDPDAPPGQIVIKYEQENFRQLFYCDPDRDFIAVKKAEWWKREGKWGGKDETRAVRFKQLPNGSWYVTDWDHTWHGQEISVGPGGKEKRTEKEYTGHREVAITPMPRDRFPKDIFNGDQLVESARKRGATIEVDR